MQPPNARGYHGTTLSAARAILSKGAFRPSEGDYHWLGPGVYFWQDAPLRAYEWARGRALKSGDEAAVIGAEIELSNILDLTDIGGIKLVKRAHALLREVEAVGEGWIPPEQRMPRQRALALADADGNLHHIGGPVKGNAGFNQLDHKVMERVGLLIEEEHRYRLNSIRCAFLEGRMIYASSYIFDRNHVQIVVLEPTVIKRMWLEDSAMLARRYRDEVEGPA